MMRVTGFLAGVGLTIAAFVLVLNTWKNPQPDGLTASTGDPTPEQIAAVAEAITEQMDVSLLGHESDQTVAPHPESAMADAEPQSGFVEPPKDDMSEASTAASGVTAAQADGVQPDYESGVANTRPQGGFSDPTVDGVPKATSEIATVTVAEADGVQADNQSVEAAQPDYKSVTADGEPKHSAEESTTNQNDHLDVQAQAKADDSDHEETVHTHLFWSPFRSEWAAKGFARRLTNSTQIPIEVINAGPGNYRAAFNYQDESERLEHIERIETITGLQLE